MRHLVLTPITPLTVASLLQTPLFEASSAHAEAKRSIDVGTSVRFNSLGSYDVGEALDMSSDGNDLGPATLGLEFFAGFSPMPRLAAEFGVASVVWSAPTNATLKVRLRPARPFRQVPKQVRAFESAGSALYPTALVGCLAPSDSLNPQAWALCGSPL